MEKQIDRINNFDLLRLFAAFQVLLGHGLEHLQLKETGLNKLYDYFFEFFPGVPIFFFISGFLIFRSFEKTPQILLFFKKRFLRIYPALYICLLLTLVLLFIDFPGNPMSLVKNTQFWIWLVGQISIFQFYTPPIFQYWGLGTPNGSLWSISVELQFYLAIPFLFYVLRNRKKLLLAVFVFAAITHLTINTLPQNIIVKILGVSLFNYLYYFLFGIIFYAYWGNVKKYIEKKFLYWISIYAILVVVYKTVPSLSYMIDETPFRLFSDVILVSVVMSFVFSNRTLSKTLLKGYDISYGIYIYHILVINFMLQRGLIYKPQYMLILMIATFVLALFSWKLVEEPMLRLKEKKIKIGKIEI